MSSSETSCSDNEELSTQKDSTTYSDFVDGNRKSDSKSTPLPISLALSKLMFQKKFMNSGNKFAELLQYKPGSDKKQLSLNQMKVTSPPNTSLVTKIKTRKEEVSESESEDFIPSSICVKETLGTKIKKMKKEVNSAVTSSSKKTEEASFSCTPLIAKVKKKKKEEVSKSRDFEATTEMSPICTLSPKKTKKKKKEHITDSEILSNEEMVNGKYKSKKSDSKREAVKSKRNTLPVTTFVKQKHTESTYSSNLFKTENEPRTNKTQIMRNFNNLHINNNRSELINNSDFERVFLKNKLKLRKSLQSDNENESATPKLPDHFKKLKSSYKGITKIDEQHNLFNKVKSSNELFFIRLPKKMKPTSLIGTKISLSKKTRVPEGSRKYDCIPVKNLKKNPVAVFTNSAGNIHLVNPAGNINMQKHIKSKHIPDLSGMWDEKKIEFPERLKQRHPLFGSDFKGKIQLEKRIEDKLDAAIKSYTKGMKKKKKKQKVVQNEQTEQEEEIFKFLNESHAPVQNDTDGGFSVKKMKKHKDKSVGLEAGEFAIKHKKVKKHKKQVKDDNLGAELEISKRKKKKKYKTSEDIVYGDHNKPDFKRLA